METRQMSHPDNIFIVFLKDKLFSLSITRGVIHPSFPVKYLKMAFVLIQCIVCIK